MTVNLYFAWVWILCGLLAGTVQGLWFHRADWLGGYDSWQRRMTRLGHVAFLGTALVNLALFLTVSSLSLDPEAFATPSILVLVGSLTMPVVCYLSAWKKPVRHLFFVPALGLVAGVALFTLEILRAASSGG